MTAAALKAYDWEDCRQHAGLQGISQSYKKCFAPRDPRKLMWSVDIDACYANSHPNDSRWDYGVATLMGAHPLLVFVEVHNMTSKETAKVIAKKAWLDRLLAVHTPELAPVQKRFVWVLTSANTLPKGTPRVKRSLAIHGISVQSSAAV